MIGFFEEREDVKSMGRLISFLLVCIGVAVAVAGMILRFDNTHLVAGVFIGSGVLEKVVSKFAEKTDAP
jgi:hypothetical protein